MRSDIVYNAVPVVIQPDEVLVIRCDSESVQNMLDSLKRCEFNPNTPTVLLVENRLECYVAKKCDVVAELENKE